MNTRFCPICRRSFGNLTVCPEDNEKLYPLPSAYPEEGTVINGEFVVMGTLGSGGMSRVFQGYEEETGKVVALKILDPRLAIHPFTIERFYRQARIALQLEHPNLVKVQSFGPTDAGHHMVAMERLRGESLTQAIKKRGWLNWERATHIVAEICAALGHAHSRGIIHRDLKPDNIQVFRTPGGGERVKVLDFGVAAVGSTNNDEPEFTEVMGTPAYMSPEQIRGSSLDGRSDLYALGVMLYEMLSGQRPFLTDDPVLACRMHLYEKPPALAECLPPGSNPPPSLVALTHELLMKSRSSRVASVGALLGRLAVISPDAVSANLGVRAPETSRTPPNKGQRRLPTGEIVSVQMGNRTTVLEAALRVRGADPQSAIKELGDIIASWRALVESSGGLIRQPRPTRLQGVFGLFRKTDDQTVALDAVRGAVQLREVLRQWNPSHAEIEVALSAVVMDAALHPISPTGMMDKLIDSRDSALANRLVKQMRPGTLLVDSRLAKQLEGRLVLDTTAPKQTITTDNVSFSIVSGLQDHQE